jgi:hypothetical protein
MSIVMDKAWIRSLERLTALNARKEKERLSLLSLEESAQIFEELCRLFHSEFEQPPIKKGKPAGLIKYWRKS